MQVVGQRSAAAPQLFKSKEFNFEKLGIGGLDAQFDQIFRRAFASRVFPPEMVSRLSHRGKSCRGSCLLYYTLHAFIGRLNQTKATARVTGWESPLKFD